MRGLVIIPTRYRKYTNQRFVRLWQKLRDSGFVIDYTDRPETDGPYDVIIASMYPQNWTLKARKKLINTPPRVKLIGFLGDPHTSKRDSRINDGIWKIQEMVMNRFDRIISLSDSEFRKWFPQWVPKFDFFPDWYGQEDIYNALPFNENPIRKCLLSGTIKEEPYPLRHFVLVHRNKDKIDYIPSPGSFWNKGRDPKKFYITEAYAKLLHSYLCCVTCSMSWQYNYAVTKYVEIPATGSLLIATECEDVKKLGFVDGVNYVKVDINNVLERIDHVLANPDAYTQIRKAGMEFVRQNYSLTKAFERLMAIINKVVA